jgi:hypothetical protein
MDKQPHGYQDIDAIIDSNSMTNYKYNYRKIKHFSEWIDQIQSIQIPEEIYIKIIHELPNKNITNARELRIICKRLKLTKYYECIQQIMCKINQLQPFILSDCERRDLLHMYTQLQEPLNKYSSNTLSMRYILRKLLELIGNDNPSIIFILPYLNNQTKLMHQDNIWKQICYDLNWKFISTS